MPFKVFIVDDNADTVNSLEKFIDAEKPDLVIAGTAYGGLEGMEKLSKEQVDIVITDISMPGMDGLTMIEELQSKLKNTRVIFITSYDRFQYASRAIKLSAFDFILKPVDNEELSQSLDRAVGDLLRDSDLESEKRQLMLASKRARFVASLTNNSRTGSIDVYHDIFQQPVEKYFFLVADSPSGLSQAALQRLDYIRFRENAEIISAVIDDELVILCGILPEAGEEPWQSIATEIAEKIADNLYDYFITISNVHISPDEYIQGYRESRQTMIWHNVYGSHAKIGFYNGRELYNSKNRKLSELEQICAQLASRKEYAQWQEIWNVILQKSEGRLRIIKLMLLNYASKMIQKREHGAGDDNLLNIQIYDITSFRSVEEAGQWLERFVQESMRKKQEEKLVEQALAYIRSHATEGLTLEQLAAKFYISPNYLSTRIHRETGIKYKQHVINAKIELAKRLLDDTRMSIDEISYAVNYENYTSFYQTFRKTIGMSPSEYRFRSREQNTEESGGENERNNQKME